MVNQAKPKMGYPFGVTHLQIAPSIGAHDISNKRVLLVYQLIYNNQEPQPDLRDNQYKAYASLRFATFLIRSA
jgi:hypothetical protein